MLREDRRLDSYQNLICSPTGDDGIDTDDSGRDSTGHVSHVGGYMEVATIYAEDGARWSSDEDAERIASDLSAGPGEDDRRRTPRPAPGEGPDAAAVPTDHDEAERGHATSSEPSSDHP